MFTWSILFENLRRLLMNRASVSNTGAEEQESVSGVDDGTERDDPKDGVSFRVQDPQDEDTAPIEVTQDDLFAAGVFVDNREKAPKSKRIRTRRLDRVAGVVLHQTAVQRSPEACAKRAHLVTAHILIGPDGRWYWNHPFTAYLYAADLFNRFTVSIEFSGNFEGHPGRGDWWKPEKFGRGRPTPMQIYRGRQILGWLKDTLPNLKYVLAHRQARTPPKRPKLTDPGWEVYSQVAMWAEANLGLDRRPNWTLGNGRPIPPSWEHPPQVSDV